MPDILPIDTSAIDNSAIDNSNIDIGSGVAPFNPIWAGSSPFFAQADAVETGAFTNFAESIDMAKTTKDRIIVSNDNYNTPAADAGAAHIFRLAGGFWVLEQTLQAPTPAGGQLYGRYVAMNGDGSRVVVERGGSGLPANQELEVWTRSGNTWTRGNTITTAFTFTTTSVQCSLSNDGNVLAVRGTRAINILRWNGSNFISEFVETQSSQASYGESIDINADGDFVVVTSVDSGRIYYYEDQGGGTWSSNFISGVGGGQVFEDSLGISNDKTTIGVHTNAIYNQWKDSGGGFVKVTNNLAVGQSMRASRMSSSGEQWIAAQTTLSQLEMYEGDTTVPYTNSGLFVPDNVEQASSAGKISYDGRLVVIGNQGWRLSNGQQGRAYSFNLDPVAATWNPNDISANMTLSNGDLRVQNSDGADHNLVRGTIARETGKYYFEVEVVSLADGGTDRMFIGLNTSKTPLSDYVGQDTPALGYRGQGGIYVQNNTQLGGLPVNTYNDGDIVMCAVDLATRNVWFGLNGTWNNAGNPAAGTGSIGMLASADKFLPAISMRSATTQTAQARFEASDFTYTIPTGFSAWGA